MTNDRPDARELLEIARAALHAEILPLLPADRRLTALMIANALGIAARELSLPAVELPVVAVTDIRNGRCDGDSNLHRLLLEDAHRRVAASNPKYLAENDGLPISRVKP